MIYRSLVALLLMELAQAQVGTFISLAAQVWKAELQTCAPGLNVMTKTAPLSFKEGACWSGLDTQRGQHSIMTCSSPGVIEWKKYSDSSCSTLVSTQMVTYDFCHAGDNQPVLYKMTWFGYCMPSSNPLGTIKGLAADVWTQETLSCNVGQQVMTVSPPTTSIQEGDCWLGLEHQGNQYSIMTCFAPGLLMWNKYSDSDCSTWTSMQLVTYDTCQPGDANPVLYQMIWSGSCMPAHLQYISSVGCKTLTTKDTCEINGTGTWCFFNSNNKCKWLPTVCDDALSEMECEDIIAAGGLCQKRINSSGTYKKCEKQKSGR